MFFKSGASRSGRFGTSVVFLVTLAACMAARPLPVAGPADLARGAQRYPDLTDADLVSGRALLVSRCSGCHQTPSPMAESPEAWPGQVAEMKTRAHLDPEQTRAVERFLVTMSTQPQVPIQSESGSSR